MEYRLKNGNSVIIRQIKVEDAETVISIISKADTETLFLARNPGEFSISIEKEKSMIEGILSNQDSTWFVAEYDGKVIGHCSVGLVSGYQRYRHRAEVTFVLVKEFCDMGIGGKMMLECIRWCEEHHVTQIELSVVNKNSRALAMYKNFGFEIVGTIPNALRYTDGTYADEYKMVKRI